MTSETDRTLREIAKRVERTERGLYVSQKRIAMTLVLLGIASVGQSIALVVTR